MRFVPLLRLTLAAAAASFALQAPAGAAVLTFDNPNCAAFTLTQTGNTFVLGCTSLVCTLSATPATQIPGNSIALNTTCTTPIQSATWSVSGNGCTQPSPGATPGQASVIENGVRTCIYTVNAGDGTLTGQGNVTVVWANTPPPPPTGCSITRTPSDGNLATAGGPITADVNCSGGGPANTWTWKKNAVAFGTTKSVNDTLPANALTAPVTYTYEATACNGPSCAAPVTTTFTVAGTAPPSMCSQYTNVVQFNLPWGGFVDTHNLNPNFMANGVAVGKFTVPPGFTQSSSGLGQASAVAFIDGAAYRTMTLSTQACDFRTTTDPTGNNGPLSRTIDQNPGLWFSTVSSGFYFVRLTPGQTYYVNIRNTDGSGNNTCGTATCNMRVSISTPR